MVSKFVCRNSTNTCIGDSFFRRFFRHSSGSWPKRWRSSSSASVESGLGGRKVESSRARLKTSALGLSGGQRQRLCIARALAIRPEVILMDEPATALDPIATSKIEELIIDLKKQYTIVIVTHNMQQAARVSDLTAFFLLGKLIEVNSTERIFTAPDQKLTEDYITGRFG